MVRPRNGKVEDKGKYGDCARYVTNALAAGGVDLQSIRDTKYSNLTNKTHAYQYGNYLVDDKAGFKKVFIHDKNRKTLKPKDLGYQKGDVIVFQNTVKHKYGHMQMYNGSQWVSDFRQLNAGKSENMGMGFCAGPGYREKEPSYAIYRNFDWQEW
jgi:hypothetical protein